MDVIVGFCVDESGKGFGCIVAMGVTSLLSPAFIADDADCCEAGST